MERSSAALVYPQPFVATDYRRNATTTNTDRQAEQALRQAADSIHLAILTIAHQAGEERSDRMQLRITRVQEHLVDACKALTRAKLHVPGLWTYAPAVVVDQDPNPEREIARLNRITTTLAMRNHKRLPHMPKGAPLSEEEEVQLAKVSNAVCAMGRARRLGALGWVCAAALSLTAWPLVGWATLVPVLLFLALGLGKLRRGSMAIRPLLAIGPARAD